MAEDGPEVCWLYGRKGCGGLGLVSLLVAAVENFRRPRLSARTLASESRDNSSVADCDVADQLANAS